MTIIFLSSLIEYQLVIFFYSSCRNIFYKAIRNVKIVYKSYIEFI
jgi:hypothetical protein